MITRRPRERALRRVCCAGLAFVSVFAAACGDEQKPPTAPTAATSPKVSETSPAITLDTADLSGMSDRQLLIAMLTRLDALEERVEREAQVVQSRLDASLREGSMASSVIHSSGLGTPVAAPSTEKSLNFALQGSVCGVQEFAAAGKIEMGMTLWGGAEGHVGVDAYGNGGKAKVRGFATGDVKIVPGGSTKLVLQICAQGTGGWTGTSPRLGARGGTAAAITPSGPAQVLLSNLLQNVSPDQVAGAASRLGMDGSRLGTALNVVSNFSLSDLPFGRGAASSLLSAIPLPVDLANLIQNPENIFQKASEGVQFAIDKLCSQTFLTGELAQQAMQACNLRNQLPNGQALVGILGGLNGLPTTLNSLTSDLTGVCNTVASMLPASIDIPSRSIDLGALGTYTTFPGFHRSLFPNVPRTC